MSAAKRRAGFCLLAAVLAIMLFSFSIAYLLCMLIVLAALAAACALMIKADAGRMELKADAPAGTRVGHDPRFQLSVSCRGRLLAAGYITVDVEINNVMFGVTRREKFVLPLRDNGDPLDAALKMEMCGETDVICISAQVWDPLGLFSAGCAAFPQLHIMCYPEPADLDLTVSDDVVGSVNTEGMVQNRKGNDPSETFAIRDYVPGDDIRTIHWKLSSKMGNVMVRESSEPSHYDVVLLPDIGLRQGEKNVSYDELNRAVAVTEELAEELLEQRISFCVAVPGRRGIQVFEVSDRREMQRLMALWMSVAVPPESGAGLDLFLSEHLDQYFTRMILVCGGKYARDISGIGKKIGTTIVSTADDEKQAVYSVLGPECDAVVLPAGREYQDRYKIVC